jgi:hypothetical protein
MFSHSSKIGAGAVKVNTLPRCKYVEKRFSKGHRIDDFIDLPLALGGVGKAYSEQSFRLHFKNRSGSRRRESKESYGDCILLSVSYILKVDGYSSLRCVIGRFTFKGGRR